MRVRPSKRIWAWLALLFTVPLLGLVATTTSASATSCSSGNISGNDTQGTWTRTYNPGCASGDTDGNIEVSWHSYLSGGDRHVWWDASVHADQIAGNDCIQVAFDWNGQLTDGTVHEDAQIMRNCKENSTRDMAAQDINIDKYCTIANPGKCSANSWPITQMQVAVYDGGASSLRAKECPKTEISGTWTQTTCDNFSSHPDFADRFAKIYRRTNAGTDQQNDPVWPSLYDVLKLTDNDT